MILQLYRDKCSDFSPMLAAEYLARDDGRKLTVSTLRRWLMSAGLWKTRKSGPVHRRWRARKEQVGEMLLLDGSHHDWFEGRRDWAVPVVATDDATNHTYARFFEEETTVDDELAETGPLAPFGRAMQELDVELNCAHSPQAKRRVERRNAVFQVRLVKALRLERISGLDEANVYLEERFLPDLNARFTVTAKQPADLHRRVPKGVRSTEVLSFQEGRVVQSDWTVQWRNRHFQLTEANRGLALVRLQVLVCEHLDGTIDLKYRQRELPFEELAARPQRVSTASIGPTGVGRVGRRRKPNPNLDNRLIPHP
ncbi:MAG: hypothetical protein AB7O62_12890 [Pirellulales bacterium]